MSQRAAIRARTVRPVKTGPLPRQFNKGKTSDDIWYLAYAATGAVLPIDWAGITLLDGSSLAKHPELLASCRQYLVLYADGRAGRRPRARTIYGAFRYLGAFVRWLSGRDVFKFSDISTAHVAGYRNYVGRRPARASSVRDRALKQSGDKIEKTLAEDSQTKLLTVIANLVKLQHAMGAGATAFSLREKSDVADMLRRRSVRAEAPTKRIPDDLFRRLIDDATRWLRIECPKVLRLHAAYEASRARKRLAPQSQRRQVKSRVMSRFGPNETILVDGLTVSLRDVSHRKLLRLVTITRGACLVLILGLIGMRISEAFSLRDGCLSSDRVRGKLRVLRIAGTLYKTSSADHGEPEKWIAGWDEPENPIRMAIAALERLPRVPGAEGLLAAAFDSRGRNARQSIERLSTAQGLKTLRLFAGMVGIGDWKIAPHQFRKTFARFVVLSGSVPTLTLMRHFKHVSVLMTERYMPNDPELINDLIEASEELVAERLDALFGAERLGGIGGQRIISNNAAFRGTAGAAARSSLVAMTMRDPASDIRLSIYGACIFDAPRANCDGKVENVGLDACSPCSNFAVGEEHLPFWTELRALLRANIAELEQLGIINIALIRQLEDAERIIAAIVGQHGQTA